MHMYADFFFFKQVDHIFNLQTPPPPLGVLSQPDLADGDDEQINQDIVELLKELRQQVMFLIVTIFGCF